MVKIKNVGPEMSLYRPEGDAEALVVATGKVIEVSGDVVGDTDDALIIEDSSGEQRAWPKAHWELAQPKAKSQPSDNEKE